MNGNTLCLPEMDTKASLSLSPAANTAFFVRLSKGKLLSNLYRNLLLALIETSTGSNKRCRTCELRIICAGEIGIEIHLAWKHETERIRILSFF